MRLFWLLLVVLVVLVLLEQGSAGRGERREGREGRRQRPDGGRRRKGRPNRDGEDGGNQDAPRRNRPNRRQRPVVPVLDDHVPHGTPGHVHHESHESHEIHGHHIPHGMPGHVHHASHEESHELHEDTEVAHGMPGHVHHEGHESNETHEIHGHHIPHGMPGHVHHASHEESHELHDDMEVAHGMPGHVHHEGHESHGMHEGMERAHGMPGHVHHDGHESHEMHEGMERAHGMPGHVHHASHEESHEMHDHLSGRGMHGHGSPHNHAGHGHGHAHGNHGGGPAWMRGWHHASHTPQFHRFLRMIVGNWNNQDQLAQEEREQAAASERHPPFESIITRVVMRDGMFPAGHVTLFMRDSMETPQGMRRMPHLMQLSPHGDGVHMVVYNFQNPEIVLNSQDPSVFLSLEEQDVINLGPACEQHWAPREVGWTPRELQFYVNGTQGVCGSVLPNGLRMTLDIASVVTPTWLTLRFNSFLENGTALSYWPTPFRLAKTFNFEQVHDELMDGEELHYCVDLRQCESEDDSDSIPANLNIDIIGGPMNEFQYVEPGAGQPSYIRYTFSELVIPPANSGERSSRITEMYYYTNESVIVKLTSRPLDFSITPSSRTLRCVAANGGMGGSGVFLNHPNPRKRQLTGFQSVSHALHYGKELRLIVDMSLCNISGDHAMSVVKSGGTRLYVHSMKLTAGEETISFNTMSLSSSICGEGIMAGGVHATMTSTSDTISLNQWGMVFMHWTECFSTEMACPIDDDAVRIYQV